MPNPNVYYEYGLMTALRKHIIPLQKEALELAFNIQSYDTIKYSPRNVGGELDRAIRDAVKITEAVEPETTKEAVADKVILRKMEMAGFEAKGDKWFLSDVISDTAFRGFGQNDKNFYVYMGKIDSLDDTRMYLDDLNVVIFRTEKQAKNMQEELESVKAERERARKEENEIGSAAMIRRLEHPGMSSKALGKKISELEGRLNRMHTIYTAFSVAPDVDTTEFLKDASSIVAVNGRYRLICSQAGKIEFGDISVDFATSQH